MQYNLPSYFPGNGVVLSQDEKFVITGTSVGKETEEETSNLVIYEADSLEEFSRISVTE